MLIGVGGLFADDLFTVAPNVAGFIIGGSWVMIALGVLLMLLALARTDLGFGVFPLAGGIGALVAESMTHWMDAPFLHGWHLWLKIGLVLLIGGGALAIVVELFAFSDESWLAALLVYAVASLVTDIVFDLGEGWDGLMNVATAVCATGLVLGSVVKATEPVEAVEWTDGPKRRRYLADYEPGWSHPEVTFFLLWGARLATAGFGVTAVAVTTMASFQLPVIVDVLMTLPTVLGAYVVIPVLWYVWVVRVVGAEQVSCGGLIALSTVLDKIVDDGRLRLQTGAALCAGYVGLALLTETIIVRPAVWLSVLLVVAAVAAGVAAARFAMLASPQLVECLAEAAKTPERTTPSISEQLGALGRSDAVFRLLPGSHTLGYGLRNASTATVRTGSLRRSRSIP